MSHGLGHLVLALSVGLAPIPARPRDPWVFRCVLDGKPRIVTLALHQDLWVAFDATTCTVAKAWKGDVEFTGAVYDTQHGPQPRSRGVDWRDPFAGAHWSVRRAGQPSERPAVVFGGYRFADGGLALNYTLVLADGAKVAVTERPEFATAADGRVVLSRRFTVAGLPAGATLALEADGAPLDAGRPRIDTDGNVRHGAARFARNGDDRVTLHAPVTVAFAGDGAHLLDVTYAQVAP